MVMGIAPETLRQALQDLDQLEEFAVWNLAQAGRYELGAFTLREKKTILTLLEKLREDTDSHQKIIRKIFERLNHGKP